MVLKKSNDLLLTTLLVFFISLFVGACDDFLLEVEFENDPVGNFDALWYEFDRYYALFGVRYVDWNSLYTVYRSQVHGGSSDAELYAAMTGLLAHLQDGHVNLVAPRFPVFSSDADRERFLFSDSDPDSLESDMNALVETAFFEYLDSAYVSAREYKLPSWFSAYGTVSPDCTDRRLGYVYVATFALDEDPLSYYEAIAKAFRGFDGVIIDLRINGGGSEWISRTLLENFVDDERTHFLESYRNGPGHNDFTSPATYSMSPSKNALRSTPWVVLTSRFTGSAAEIFVMGAKVLPLATVVGDTTWGILGPMAKKVLPNGWEFTLSPGLVRSINGVCYEGVGIPPDIYVKATRADVDAGQDAVMDTAIEILESSIMVKNCVNKSVQ